MEHTGLLLLGIAAIAYIIFLAVASIRAFPEGLIGLVVLGGSALLLLQVVKDRLNNEEDNYYSKNVDI